MKKTVILLSLSLISFNSLKAQFYYRDIVSTQQTNEELRNYKKAGIKSIKIKGTEPTGEEMEDFFCEKKISKDYKKTTLYTRTGNTGMSLMESHFNDKGLIVKTYDSSDLAVSVNHFFYDNNNKLIKTTFRSKSNDDDFINEVTEEHLYEYGSDGILTSMKKIKNSKDTLVILFSADEKNNITVEKETKNGGKYYYYYDEQNRFTDMVHINEFKQKLVADYIYEYNENGQIDKMTVTQDGNDNFTVWKYDYENGLKIKERIFDKNGMLMGKIFYEYK